MYVFVLAMCLLATTTPIFASAMPLMEDENGGVVFFANDDQPAVARAEKETGAVDLFGNGEAENSAEEEELDSAWMDDGDSFIAAEAKEESLAAAKTDKKGPAVTEEGIYILMPARACSVSLIPWRW